MRIILALVIAVVAGGATLLVTGVPGDRTLPAAAVAREFATALRDQNVSDAEALLDDRAKGPSPNRPTQTQQALLQVRALNARADEVDLTSEFYVTGNRVGWLMAYQLPAPDDGPDRPPRGVEAWHEVTVADGRVVSFSLTPTAETGMLAAALARADAAQAQPGPQPSVPVPATPGRDQMQENAIAGGATVVGILPRPGPSPVPALVVALVALVLTSAAFRIADRRRRAPTTTPRIQERLVRELRPMLARRGAVAGPDGPGAEPAAAPATAAPVELPIARRTDAA